MKKLCAALLLMAFLLTGCNYLGSNDYITVNDRLFLSVADGNIQGILDAVDAGASLESFDWNYSKNLTGYLFLEQSPLFYALKESSVEVVECLLQNGADANTISKMLGTEMPAIFYAVWNNSYQKTQLLIQHGADVNVTFQNTDVIDQLFIGGGRLGTEKESVAILQLLVDSGSTIDAANIDKAVDYASEDKEVVLNLLRQLVLKADKTACASQDPLLIALLVGDTAARDALLSSGHMADDPEFLSRIAGAFGSVSDVERMTQLGYPFGSSALASAAIYNNEAVFTYLCDQGIALDRKDASCVNLCAENGNAEVLGRLLEIDPVYQDQSLSISSRNLYEVNVINDCIRSENIDVVTQAYQFFENYQFTATDLYTALDVKAFDIVELILDHNSGISVGLSIANLCGSDMEIMQYATRYCPHWFAEKFVCQVAESAGKSGNTAVLDALAAFDVDADWKLGATKAAIEYGRLAVLEYLYGQGYSSDLLLMEAVRNPSTTIFELVLEHTTDINIAEEEYGRTALHWAVFSGYKDYAQTLLENGADVSIADKSGKSGEDYITDAKWDIIDPK